MSWIPRRLRALWRWQQMDSDIDDEIRFHLSEEADDRIALGEDRTKAERDARRDFGSTALVAEQARRAWRPAILADLLQDARYAWRSMRRHRAFTAVAMTTLAVGIGATTAVVSLVDGILLKPLPHPGSDRLVRIVERYPTISVNRSRGIPYSDFLQWRAQTKTLAAMAAVAPMAQRTVATTDGVAGLWGAMASGNLFEVLRTRARLGRTLLPADDGHPVAIVLTHDTWQRHFQGNPDIVGQAVELRAGALQTTTMPMLMTVVGVLPADFTLEQYQFFIPIVVRAGQQPPLVVPIARLGDGVALQASNDEANVLGNEIRAPLAKDAPALGEPRFRVQSLKEQAIAEVRPALRLFLGAVSLLFLIVCANIANLLLARGWSRSSEIAARLAIGASRGRIMRQILTECLVLALAGGMAGVAIAVALIAIVRSLAAIDAPGVFRLTLGTTVLPRAGEVHTDFTTIAIAFGIATVATVIFGLLPAMRMSRGGGVPSAPLRNRSGDGGGETTRAAIVVGQVMFATVLLIAAGLLLRSFRGLVSMDKGYDGSKVIAMNLLLPDRYSVANKAETIDQVLQAVRALPEVRSAGFARHGLLIGEEIVGDFVPPGRTADEMKSSHIRMRPVSGGFLTAMGVGTVMGRDFGVEDDRASEPMIVMNELAARLCFGDGAAVGQTVAWQLRGHSAEMRVIGVVENLRQQSLSDDLVPEVFINYRQALALLERWGESAAYENETAIGFLSFAILVDNDPAATLPALRNLVRRVDSNIGIDVLIPLSRLVEASLTRQRFYAVIVGVLAAIAGFLAGVGVYGVLAYAVEARTKELGVRIALGARRLDVVGLVLRRGAAAAAIGITCGLALALLTAPLLRGLLFGVQPLDARTFAGVSVLIAAIAVAASLIPAWRAARVVPLVALRQGD